MSIMSEVMEVQMPAQSSSIAGDNSYHAVVKIDSSPQVRFYQKIEWPWASKSLCLLAQKVY